MKKEHTKRKHLFVIGVILLLLTGCSSHTTDITGSDLSIDCLNAGKADAFILRTENSTVLIDCGEKGFGSEILDKLEENDITKVDVLFISHFDKDHVGGAAKVINNIDVGQVYTSYQTKNSEFIDKFYNALSEHKKEATEVKEDFSFSLDGVDYEVIVPESDQYEENDSSNNSSLVVRVGTENIHILFPGDCEEKRLQELIKDKTITSDILKVPHHGKMEKSSEAFLNAVRPQYAIITSSDEETESEKLLNLLEKKHIATYLTRKGGIEIQIIQGEISVTQEQQ